MNNGIVTRWGGGVESPTVDDMRAALDELSVSDPEHPSTWLSDDGGWTVDVYESGLVIFSEKDREICRQQGVSRGEALQLWLLLQQERYDEIQERLTPAESPK